MYTSERVTMFDLFGSLPKIIKLKPSSIDTDNYVFRLHYKATVLILVVCSFIATCKQYFGDPINCISPLASIPQEALNAFCWSLATFSVKKHFESSDGRVMPGIGTYVENEDAIVYHTYYQWVSLILFLQAMLFYTPQYVWTCLEGGVINMLAANLDKGRFVNEDEWSPERKAKTIEFLETNKGHHKLYTIRFLCCEIGNLINVIGQIFFLDWFLGGQFSAYGRNYLIHRSTGDSENPMDIVFPKVTKCTFKYFGPSGGAQISDSMCILSLNIVNEKIFIAIWFWFIILAIITSLSVTFRILFILFSPMRLVMLRGMGYNMDKSVLDSIVQSYSAADCFLLFQLGKNVNVIVLQDILQTLAAYKKITEPP